MSNPLGETITIFSGRIRFVLSTTLNVGKVPSNLEQMKHIEEGDTWWEKCYILTVYIITVNAVPVQVMFKI